MTTATQTDRREAHRQELQRATQALLTSDGWRAWVRARAAFRTYSLNNQMLIALQCPDATRVAGFRTWLNLGRCVRKGERAIRIAAPLPLKARDGHGGEETRIVFRMVPVFDITMTEPLPDRDPVPLDPPRAPVTGDSHAHLIPRLEHLITERGWTLTIEPLQEGTGGYWDAENQQIVLNETLSGNQKLRILVHELAHAHGISYQQYGRAQAEVIADTITHLVLTTVGLDTTSDTIPYIASWTDEGDPAAAAVDATRVIDQIATTLETALTGPAGTAG